MTDLGAQLRRRAHAGGTAVVCGDETVSYRELDARADAWAALLRSRLAPGERVATLCRSSIEQIALLYGCARAGTLLVPLSYRLRAAELAGLIDDATPALLLADEACAGPATAAVRGAAHSPEVLPLAAPTAAAPVTVPVDAEAPVLLVYTAGTRGRPRGVPLSHRMCVATGAALDAVARLTPADVVLQLLPQYHVGGWTVLPLTALARGATLVLEPDFVPARALRRIAAHGVTVTMAVPTMYRTMLDAARPADLRTLRLAIAGGAELPAGLARAWWALGVPLCQGYGLTEAGPNVLCVPPSDVDSSAGWAGLPYPGVDVTLAGVPAGPGTGELLVRGPGVFGGYWRGPRHAGWLHTGDLAERDGRGWYRIVGRLDDRYVSGGENVDPADAERALRAHPAVSDAVVVGVPDERWGAVGVAFVELTAAPPDAGRAALPDRSTTDRAKGSARPAADRSRPSDRARRADSTSTVDIGEPDGAGPAAVDRPDAPRAVDGAALREWCRRGIAGYKVPARVCVVAALPRTALGKPRRDVVRRWADESSRERA